LLDSLIHGLPVRKLLIGTLALIVIAHALAHGLIMSFVWMPAINTAEKSAATQYANSVRAAIQGKTDAMLASTRDYAEWQAMYNYVTGNISKHSKKELDLDSLDHERLLVDGIFILKEDGSLGASSLANSSSTEEMDEVRAIVEHRLRSGSDNEEFHFQTSRAEILLVSFARPKSMQAEPLISNGAVVLYIALTNAMMQTKVRPRAGDRLDPNAKYYRITGDSESLSSQVHEHHASATFMLPALNAKDRHVYLRIFVPLFVKPLFSENAPKSFLAALFTWICVALAVYLFVDKLVLRSFETFARKATRLADGAWKQNEQQFKPKGSNEAAQLAHAINKLCQAQADAYHRANSLYMQAKNNLENYRTIFNNSDDPMLITYKQTIVDVNDAAERALGLSAEELLGREFHDVAKVTSNEIISINSKRATKTQYKIYEREYLESKNNIRWGQKACALRTLSDITEVKQMQRKILNAEKMQVIGEFSGGVAHDINNILGSILGHQQLVELVGPVNEKQQESLRRIESTVQQGTQLVRRLLKFSKGHGPTRQSMDLVTVLRDTINFVKTMLPRSVNIDFESEPQSSLQMINEDDILQIVMNLCVNASQAMKGHGQITIQLTTERFHGDGRAAQPAQDTEMLCLTVRDRGPGIPEEHLSNVFTAFFTTKNESGGTGLGLATVKRICDGYGWNIAIHNDAGVVFKISMAPANVETQEVTTSKGEILWFDELEKASTANTEQ
jgi:PAS domain S-box-containing protein